MPAPKTIDAYLDSLKPDDRAMIEALIALVRAAAPGLTEQIKWNAPSFSDGGEDRITLGINRGGGMRVVLHRGAKNQDAGGFACADPAALADWPSPDRGIVMLKDGVDLEAKADALKDLCTRWIAATRSAG